MICSSNSKEEFPSSATSCQTRLLAAAGDPDISDKLKKGHRIGEIESQQPALTGGWSYKLLLGHLVDSASNNHQRFVRASLQGELTFPGYDQERLVELQQFREMDWGFLVDFWAAYNRFLAHVIGCLPAEAAKVTCHIGNNAPMALDWLAMDYVEHLKHHLNQIVGPKFSTTYGK